MYRSAAVSTEVIHHSGDGWKYSRQLGFLAGGIILGILWCKISYLYMLGLMLAVAGMAALLCGREALLLLFLALFIPVFPQFAKPVMNRYVHWYEILFLGWAALTLIRLRLGVNKLKWESSLWLPLLLYFLMIFISAFNSLDFKGAVYLALTPFMAFVVLYHFVFQPEQARLRIPFTVCYLIGVTLMAGVGVWEHLTGDYLFYDNIYLRLYGSRFLEAGISKISSTMINSVHYGPFITIAASIVFALLFTRVSWWVRLVLVALMGLLVYNIMLVNSRTTTLMLALAVALILLFKWKTFIRPRNIILLLMVLALTWTFTPSWVKDRFKPFVSYLDPASRIEETITNEEIKQYDISSNDYRMRRMRRGWEYFLDHPIIGAGILPNLNPHHDLLQILACHGLLGLLFFLWLMAYMAKKLYLGTVYAADEISRHLYIGVLAGFVSFGVLGVFNNAMEFLPNFFYLLFYTRIAPAANGEQA